MNQTEPGLKGLGGSITFESLPRLFPGVSEPSTGLVCLRFVARVCVRVVGRLQDNADTTPACLAGV